MDDARPVFLRRVRARMRLAWFVSTAQRTGPYLGFAVLALFLADWLTWWDGALRTAGALLGVFMLTLTISALALRISPWDAARSAERGLGARDVLTTALEFDDPLNELHREIQDRARRLAAEAESSRAIPIRADVNRLRQVGMALILAILVSVLPPLGSSPAISAGIRDALDAEAEEVEKVAQAVEESDVGGAEELVAELERLAKELREAETVEQAMESLDDSQHRLDARVDPRFLAQKAAVQGLARDLSLRPLTADAPVDAASQLRELADSLGDLSEPEQRALEDRLRDLAASQSAGNPSLSDQLSTAANSLSSGELDAAARALRNAANSQSTGLSGARSQQAITETQRALDGVRARLSGAGTQGQGQGQGEGQGQGQGTGGLPGQSGPSGVISGVQPGDGNAAGQGGQGTVGGGTREGYGTEVDTARIYDPIDRPELFDLVQVGIDGGTGEGSIIGRGEAPTARGQSVVPYAQVLPEYLNDAADALSALQLPPSMRGIVQAYFDRLAAEAR